ncbi:hypothetical protein B0H14DRAFT_2647717 [Mycena olivaceomarginata]|nr:hypothetical protein B0H14DRAFT_2647717 [Mycena olivaceomarginata]
MAYFTGAGNSGVRERSGAVVGARWVPLTPRWGHSGLRRGEVGRGIGREARLGVGRVWYWAAVQCGGLRVYTVPPAPLYGVKHRGIGPTGPQILENTSSGHLMSLLLVQIETAFEILFSTRAASIVTSPDPSYPRDGSTMRQRWWSFGKATWSALFGVIRAECGAGCAEAGSRVGEVGRWGAEAVLVWRDVIQTKETAAHSAGVWRSNAVKAPNINPVRVTGNALHGE